MSRLLFIVFDQISYFFMIYSILECQREPKEARESLRMSPMCVFIFPRFFEVPKGLVLHRRIVEGRDFGPLPLGKYTCIQVYKKTSILVYWNIDKLRI